MNKEQDFALTFRPSPEVLVQAIEKLRLAIQHSALARHKIGLRTSGRRRRPLDVPGGMSRRDADRDRGEIQPCGTLPIEKCPRSAIALACCGDQYAVLCCSCGFGSTWHKR